MPFDFDVIVIGAGVIGAAVADELASKKYNVAVLERNYRIAEETSEGNSGIIHGGFDPTPNKLNAKLNLEGRKIFEQKWFKELDFPWRKTDSLVIALKEKEVNEVQKLYDRGITNGLTMNELKILDQKAILALEPNINPKVQAALLCTASYIVDPVLLTHSLMNRALKNKAQLFIKHEVIRISIIAAGFKITTLNLEQKEVVFTSKFIVNAAGHYSEDIAAMIDCHDFTLKRRRGQYCILEKTEAHIINNHVIFMVPTIYGKGVIVAPMTNGHLLVGPTAVDNVKKEETRLISMDQIRLIDRIGLKIIPKLNMQKTCKVFSGSRPISVETDDFIIKKASNNQNFINIAGIKSPGLSSAPAIAKMVLGLIKGGN